MAARFRRLKHYLIPHGGNRYKPGLFSKESVAALALALFIVQGVSVFVVPFVLQKTGFTAAILPAALADLTNHDRLAMERGALTPDPLLAKAAQQKANDMAAKGYFSHVSPDGKTPWYWLDSAGYDYTYAGENLAVDFTDSVEVEEAWMNSPEHHANIVKPQYTQIGVGVAHGVYQGRETTFVVELFAAVPHKEGPLGTRVGALAQKVAAAERASDSPSSGGVKVLGAQTKQPPSGLGAAATMASSPRHTLAWAFGIFAALIALLLGLAVFVRIQVQYVEVLAGGLILIGLALGLLLFNTNAPSSVQVPHDTQAASVSLAL